MWHGGLLVGLLRMLMDGLGCPHQSNLPCGPLARAQLPAPSGRETLLALVFHTSLGSAGPPLWTATSVGALTHIPALGPWLHGGSAHGAPGGCQPLVTVLLLLKRP